MLLLSYISVVYWFILVDFDPLWSVQSILVHFNESLNVLYMGFGFLIYSNGVKSIEMLAFRNYLIFREIKLFTIRFRE